jgi:hypothetical protein
MYLQCQWFYIKFRKLCSHGGGGGDE